jgi:HSP20 family molecular chaperone IbpA
MSKREPPADTVTTDKEVNVVVKIPYINNEDVSDLTLVIRLVPR